MSDRRRASRFISPGTHGVLRLMQDVHVEHATAGEITVLAATRPPAREQLIQMRDHTGRRIALRVQTVSNTVVPGGEMLRNRVVLRVLGAAVPGGRTGREESGGNGGRGIAVLVRRIAARTVNVSSSGCFLELAEYIGEGAIALLDIAGVQRGAGDPVRLCRAVHVPGGDWPWRAAAEFLSLDAPLPASVRNAAARLEALLDGGPFVGDLIGSVQSDSGRASDVAEATDAIDPHTGLAVNERVS